MNKGIVFRGEIQPYKLGNLAAISSESFDVPYDKTLFVEGVRIPMDLLPAAWHFLERWDMAVPLWRYGKTAQDVGTVGEREETRLIIRDLRVLLHAYELLFVRRNKVGLEFMATWERECSSGGEKRLAFLRALYQVKPKICVLPTSWLAEVSQREAKQIKFHGAVREQPINAGKGMVTVELEPGRLVKVHKGDEERVLEHFRRLKEGSARAHN